MVMMCWLSIVLPSFPSSGWLLATDDPHGCQSCKQEAVPTDCSPQEIHTARLKCKKAGEGKWLMLQGTKDSEILDVYLLRLFYITPAKSRRKRIAAGQSSDLDSEFYAGS